MTKAIVVLSLLLSIVNSAKAQSKYDMCSISCTPECLRRIDGLRAIVEENDRRCGGGVGIAEYICTPGRVNSDLFFIRRTRDGEALGGGFRNIDDCSKGLGNRNYFQTKLVCTPGLQNSDLYFLRNPETGNALGAGFRKVDDCALALAYRTEQFVCTPGMTNSDLIFIRNISTGDALGGGFRSVIECIKGQGIR